MIVQGLRRLLLLVAIVALAAAFAVVPHTGSVSAQTGTVTTTAPVLPSGVCGTIGSFTPATTGSAGSLVIASTTFAIAPGVTLGGQDLLVARGAGSTLCFIPGALNASNQIMGGTILSSVPSYLTVCGTVSAYTASTSLSIGGLQFALDTNATFVGNGGAGPTVGQNEEIALTISPLGLVLNGVINATPSCAAGTTTISGGFTTYSAPTATVPGYITIGASTYFIAAGTNVTSATHSVPLAARTVSGHHHVGSVATQRAE